jgi:glycosyltransferase involved in cell wall biosynthesis
MKVLFVSDSTTVSGAEIVLLGCVDALQAHGRQAHGFVRHTNTRLIDAFRSRGVPVTATAAFSERIIRTTANPVELFGFARSLCVASSEMADVIRAEHVDVVHSTSYPAALYAGLAAARTGSPHIWHEHNIKRIHAFNRMIYRRLGNTCRWVIGPSDAVTSNLGATGIDAGKLRTVYNGIDLSRFRDGSKERIEALRRDLGLLDGEQAVGLFGQMLHYKGHRTLIEAAPQILEANPNARFFFVGALENPPYQLELQFLLEERGLADRVHFTGWRDDVQHIIRAMDVVVVATTTPEPAALMLMEAGAMERPIVATRTGGTPEIIADEDTGLLFAPGDAGQLAHQVNRVLGSREFGRKLGRAARARVESRFNRDAHVRAIFELYGEPASVPAGAMPAPLADEGVKAVALRGRSLQSR